MGNPVGPNGRSASTRVPRRTVATFDNYREAERAVDYLSDRGFAVERAAIVARGLHFVEQVTGRRRWIDAAVRGMFSGAIAGFLVGWLFGLFDWFNPIIASAWLALWGLLFGAVTGALIGLIAHWMLRGRRDFDSVGGVVADSYEVLVDEEVADEALRLLSEMDRAPDGAPATTGDGGEARTTTTTTTTGATRR